MKKLNDIDELKKRQKDLEICEKEYQDLKALYDLEKSPENLKRIGDKMMILNQIQFHINELKKHERSKKIWLKERDLGPNKILEELRRYYYEALQYTG